MHIALVSGMKYERVKGSWRHTVELRKLLEPGSV